MGIQRGYRGGTVWMRPRERIITSTIQDGIVPRVGCLNCSVEQNLVPKGWMGEGGDGGGGGVACLQT